MTAKYYQISLCEPFSDCQDMFCDYKDPCSTAKKGRTTYSSNSCANFRK